MTQQSPKGEKMVPLMASESPNGTNVNVILQPGPHMAGQILTDKGRKSWAPECRIASGYISYSFFLSIWNLYLSK